MESDAEETKSQLVETENRSTPRHKHKKKKRKVQGVDATIQVIPEKPERTAPVLGYFPSGFDPTKNPDPNSTRIGLYRQSSRAKRFQLVVHPGGTNVDFVGTSYTGEGATRESTNYGLGVLDKETGTLKIVPIVANKIFRLEPRVRGYDYSKPASVAMGEGVGELTRDEKADKHSKLQRTYGTKKSIMENKKMNDLKQEVGPEAQMNLDVKFKQTVPNKEALADPEVHIIRSIPPYNESAITPQEVYPLDKIIVATEWDVLQDIYDLVQGGAKLSVDAFPTFVCNRIHKLQDIEVEDEKFKLACIFSYITHLLKFKDQHSMDGVSSARGHKIPNLLYHKFRSMFASESKRLPEDKTKLLISYVLVLTLFVDEFQTDLTDIAKDLRMSSITLRKYYQNLGCKLFHKNSFCFAELAVPLQFPEVRKRKKRSNR